MSGRLAGRPDRSEGPVRCALVNNMPDAAFCATERQFVDLVNAGSGCQTVELSRHTMPGVPRGERIRAHIDAKYRPVEDIASNPPDLLVVTGANPIASCLQDEPYWPALCGLLQWATANVPAMVLSCLSAHAALAIFDGIQRTALPAKCTGVFTQETDPTHPLTAGLDESVALPHSRHNAVPVEAVAAAGYAVAVCSDEAGWSVVSKTIGRSDVVLVQAHPEYDPASLLREYARDIRRYTAGERDEIPCLPMNCVAGPDWEPLRLLNKRVIGGERSPELVAAFPFDEVGERAPWPWRSTAQRLYANLLAAIPERSA